MLLLRWVGVDKSETTGSIQSSSGEKSARDGRNIQLDED